MTKVPGANVRLDRLDHLPPALIGARPSAVLDVFPNPTLITLEGGHSQPLWLTCMLHGNETTSFEVLCILAERYRRSQPPRSLSIFVGNVQAMAAGVRFLPEQPDFNRIWDHGDGPYHRLVEQVIEEARVQNPFASIDIHNNTGDNPHYGCVNALRPADLYLASMFANIGVYYRTPPTTQSIAFSRFCPAITIECGKSGDSQGLARAVRLIDDVMSLITFPNAIPRSAELKIYQTVGALHVDPAATLAIEPDQADVIIPAALEASNFRDLPAGSLLVRAANPSEAIRVINEHGADISAEHLEFSADAVYLKHPATPAMVTRDLDIIRQDCLGYLMQPMPLK